MRKTIKKIMSSVLSAALAFGVCVPMASIAPVTAYAIEDESGDVMAEKCYVNVSVNGTGGIVSPKGSYECQKGQNMTLVCTPSDGYALSSITVNGADQTHLWNPTTGVFNLTVVQSNTNVVVEFVETASKHTVSVTAGEGGSASPHGTWYGEQFFGPWFVDNGSEIAFFIHPDFGYQVKRVLVNGVDYTDSIMALTLTIPSVDSDLHIDVQFAAPPVPVLNTSSIEAVEGASIDVVDSSLNVVVPIVDDNQGGQQYELMSKDGFSDTGDMTVVDNQYFTSIDTSSFEVGSYELSVSTLSNQLLKASFFVVESDTPAIHLNTPDGVEPGTEYEVYRVFDANVLDKEVVGDKNITNAVVTANKYITDIEFAEGVEGLFDLSENQTAYDAAIALKDALHGDDAVAQGIAWAKKLDAQYVGTITAGSDLLEVGSTGYYLIVNKNEVNSIENAVSYPIFVAVGNETVEITEKSAIPYITKYVKEDSNGEWQKYADFAKKDIQEFKFEITMPNNIAQYTSYEIGINDETLHYMAMESIKVFIDGTEIDSSAYDYNDGDFTFTDIKALGVELTSDSMMTIEYKAFANDAIDVPANNEAHTVDPYVNKVRMFYSNNPANDNSRGQSVFSATNEYSYGIRVKVEERITNAPLPGFGFTVADSDGNLVADADGNTTWMTNMDGVIELPYLDADDYTITCVEKAEGYDADVETFTLKLLPTYDKTLGTLDEFGADVPEGFNAQRRAGVEKADNTWVLADGGYGNVTLSIPSNMNMPITGEGGYALIIAAGLALITVAVVRTYRSRRNTIA